MDICLNKSFKTYLQGAWEEYMVNQVRRSSDALSIAMASRTEIIQWVVAANNCLNSQRDIIKSNVESLTLLMVVRITWPEFLQSCQFLGFHMAQMKMTQIHFRAWIVPLLKTPKKKQIRVVLTHLKL